MFSIWPKYSSSHMFKVIMALAVGYGTGGLGTKRFSEHEQVTGRYGLPGDVH